MYRKLMLGLCLAAVAIVFPGTALAKSDTPKAPAQAAAVACPNPCTVQATDANVFTPANITVAAGTTITWNNTGSADHTVTDAAGSFDSGDLPGGQTFKFTVTTPGTISYFCQYHKSLGMVGTIVVTGSPGGGGGTTSTASSPPPSPSPIPTITSLGLPSPPVTPSPVPSQKYFPKIGGLLLIVLLLGIGVGYLKTKKKLADKG
jgi:plastocyanin